MRDRFVESILKRVMTMRRRSRISFEAIMVTVIIAVKQRCFHPSIDAIMATAIKAKMTAVMKFRAIA